MTETTEPVVINDLYARRIALKRELAGVEAGIARCRNDWVYQPPSTYEDRDGAYAHVSYRTCKCCGVVNERVQFRPRESLGNWALTAKFRKEA
jgi:hypothetical protein